MAISVIKSLMLFSVVLSVPCTNTLQFTINIDGIEQVTSLLANFTDTQVQMAETLNQISTILRMQTQQLNDIVSVLEKQQEMLQDISHSLAYQTAGVKDQKTELYSVKDIDSPITAAVTIVTTETPMPTLSIRDKTELSSQEGRTEPTTMETKRVPTTATAITDTPMLNPIVRDCSELSSEGGHSSGIFTITAREGTSFDVYCNMDDHDGGWTVFQKRYDGTVNFYRNWDSYVQGFGSLEGEFWIGLQTIHLLTNTPGTIWQLMIMLEDFGTETAYANYQAFSVGDAESNYTLTFGTYSGTARNSMTSGFHSLNNQPFTTYDRDNDDWNSGNYAENNQGGWWYRDCSRSNLNGRYLGSAGNSVTGIFWYDWEDPVQSMVWKGTQSLKATTMMIRPMQ